MHYIKIAKFRLDKELTDENKKLFNYQHYKNVKDLEV